MNLFIKPSLVLGALAGVIFGILLLIPFIAPFMFFFSFSLAGIIVIVFLKKTNSIGIVTLQDGCLIGALAGFSSLITTSAVYLPVSLLIDKLFNAYSESFNISQSLSVISYNIMAVSMLIFFTAILSAIINAFSGMITAFFFEKLEQKNLTFKDHLKMEQFDETF